MPPNHNINLWFSVSLEKDSLMPPNHNINLWFSVYLTNQRTVLSYDMYEAKCLF